LAEAERGERGIAAIDASRGCIGRRLLGRGKLHALPRADAEPVSSSDEDVLRFIAASFPSVWALELLLVLKEEARAWTREQLIARLRASELVIGKALDALVAAGLASVDKAGATYLPANADLEDSVTAAERLYATRPNQVRRTIIAHAAGSASAFAEAFRLRKDKE
jgi:hypothetical protein